MYTGYARVNQIVSDFSTRKSETNQSQLEILENQLGRQNLLIQTLLVLLLEKGLFEEEEFLELLDEIDALDGKKDGAFTPKSTPKKCRSCGKTNSSRKRKCMWCGADLVLDDVIVKLP